MPADATATANTSGTAVTVTTTTAGQNATVGFTATAGQTVSITCAETTGLGSVTYRLLDPAGATLKTAYSCPTNGALFTSQTLAAAGAHSITVDLADAETGTVTLAVKPG